MTITDWLNPPRERLMVVCDPGHLARSIRARYSQFDVTASATYLEGIAALAEEPARGVLVGVDLTSRRLGRAVAGLRKAAGPSSRVILCCWPSGEPAAQEVLSAGADDYLIYPPTGSELDTALALPTAGIGPADLTPTEPSPTWDELATLAGLLAGIGDGPRAMLERLCRLLADSLRTTCVRIIAGEYSGHVGDPTTEPALVEDITAGGRRMGRVSVGPRRRDPFTPGEAEKLRHYARLIAHLLDAARQQHHWQELAMIDPVSQLPNRRCLLHALDSILGRAKAEQFHVTVLIFDLDGFKHFNDAYGHAAGDEIIHDVSRLLRKHCRKHDIVSRYAGDEFVAVFWDAERPRTPGSRHPTDVLAVLRRFKKALESHEFPRLGPEAVGCITISGGLATFPWDAQSSQDLIDRADEALLQAKRDGKNRIYLVGSEGRPVEEPPGGTGPPSD